MRRDSILRQFNYDYPIRVFKNWKKENKKAIHKWVNIISFIILVIMIILFCNHHIKKVFASYVSYATEKQEREAYLEGQQMMRELALKNKLAKEQTDKELQEKKRIDRIVKEWQIKKQELDEHYQVGNYIMICYTQAKLLSRVGQIRKIVGLTIYGTWGDSIEYDKSKIKNLSWKEYREEREKENNQRIKANKKKKFVSWGTIGNSEPTKGLKQKIISGIVVMYDE